MADIMFSDSSGYASINPSQGSGNASVEVSSDCNCGDDRTLDIAVVTVAGTVSVGVGITQEGYREQFIPSDSDEGFCGADGDKFLSVKAQYADSLPVECGGGVIETTTTNTFVILDVEDAGGLSGSFDFEGTWPFMEGVSTTYPYVNVEKVTFEMGVVFPDSVLQSNATSDCCLYASYSDSENANALIAGMQVLPNTVYNSGYCGYGFVPNISSSGECLLFTLVMLASGGTSEAGLNLGCGTDKEQDLTLTFEPTGSGRQVTITTPSGTSTSNYIFSALNRIFTSLMDDSSVDPVVWFSKRCGGYFTKMKITVTTNKEYEI